MASVKRETEFGSLGCGIEMKIELGRQGREKLDIVVLPRTLKYVQTPQKNAN